MDETMFSDCPTMTYEIIEQDWLSITAKDWAFRQSTELGLSWIDTRRIQRAFSLEFVL